jgi:putative methionine-R-sulfoxide reductase with GAF domain
MLAVLIATPILSQNKKRLSRYSQPLTIIFGPGVSVALDTLQKLNRLTRQTDHFEQILQDAAELLVSGLNYYAVCCYLLDDACQCAVLTAACGGNGDYLLESNYRVSLLGNSTITSTLQSTGSVVVSDTPPAMKEFFPAAQSEITCPIFDRSKAIGVLCCYFDRRILPGEGETVTCQLIADLLANAYWDKKLDKELEVLTRQSEHRMRLQIAANQIAILAGQLKDLAGFLQDVVDLICEAYGLYYAGIFLVDEKNEWAVLHAGYGTAGRLMVQNDHRLRVGGNSMVGTAIRQKEARIAMNIGKERVHFRNPHLPDTRSEMAIPLHLDDFAFGAMTIQSREEAAFQQDDILSLQTIAHFLSPAIWLRLHP